MKITKKQLEELVDKTGALIGSKSLSPKYGNGFIGSYDVTDDHVEKTTQDRSYETPYRRYFGEDDLSTHPLFDISQKAKTYDQFIDMAKKENPKMDDEETKEAAALFGYRKDKKRIVKEKEINESTLRFSDGINVNTSGPLRPLELPDGWYVVGNGKLIPVKDKEDANSLIKSMSDKPIKESAHSLLEKIVNIPQLVESNNTLFIPRKQDGEDSKWIQWNKEQPIIDGVQINQYTHDGIKTGLWERYYDNGQLWYKGNYINGGEDGIWELYYDNGKLMYKGNYVNGKSDGMWEYYDKKGRLSMKGAIKYDKRNGVWEYYHPNGQLSSKGEYKNGEQNGVWEYYYENGQLESKILYNDGKEIKNLPLTDNSIRESAHGLLEKIVKIKTKDDVLPKINKSNTHIDKAILHLNKSKSEIEKHKDNPNVSSIFKSLEKSIKSLENIVDKIEDKTDLMDSINESIGNKVITIDDLRTAIKMAQETVLSDLRFEDREPKYSEDEIIGTILGNNVSTNRLPFDEEIKRELRKLYSGSIYDKVGKIDDRIDQLFNIHHRWLEMAKRTYSSDEIAKKLFKNEKNLKENINGSNNVMVGKNPDFKVVFDANEQKYIVYYKGKILTTKYNKKDILSYLN